jgi:hypothetical protein
VTITFSPFLAARSSAIYTLPASAQSPELDSLRLSIRFHQPFDNLDFSGVDMIIQLELVLYM